MALEKKPSFKESRGDTLGFIQGASPEQLLEIATGTALQGHSLVKNFNDPSASAYYQKTEALRSLISRGFRRQADFRGMVIRAYLKSHTQGKGNANPEQAKGTREESQKPEQKKGK
jgi:hypothetical protein